MMTIIFFTLILFSVLFSFRHWNDDRLQGSQSRKWEVALTSEIHRGTEDVKQSWAPEHRARMPVSSL